MFFNCSTIFSLFVPCPGTPHELARSKAIIKSSLIFLLVFILTLFNSYFDLYGPEIYGLNYQNIYQEYPYIVVMPTIIKPIYYMCIFIVLFTASRNLQKKAFLGSIIKKLGEYSFGIYLVHAFFIYIGYFILKKLSVFPNKIIFYPLLFFFVITLSFFCVVYLSNFPYSSLIGIEKNKKVR